MGTRLVIIFISGILINNIVLSRSIGICPFLGVSKQVETAIGMGLAVTFVMTVSSAATWVVQTYVLEKFDLMYLQTITFILIIAALVQFVEMVILKSSPTLYQGLGVYLPLITTNCAVLGVTIINVDNHYNLLESMINGCAVALGFTLAIVIFAGIRERLAFSISLSRFRVSLLR